MPPWKNTSSPGHTSCRQLAPLRAITSLMSVRNHEGTPERLVTFSSMLASTSAGNFSCQSLMRAMRLLGTLNRPASGGMRLMSVALKSPTCTPGLRSSALAKLPPSIKAFPPKSLLSGLRLR